LKLLGIPIRLHFTFLLLLGVLLVTLAIGGKSYAEDVALILSAFTCVLLHELGHALAARRFGVATLEIVMFLIGGVARLSRQVSPPHEFWIAIAGPAVNFILAAAFWLLPLPFPTFWRELAALNLSLGLFNLLPAFPMDGGRVLRAVLALRYDAMTSTRYASNIGRFLAIGMAVFGIWQGQWILLLIAYFVFTSAKQEYFAQKSNTLMRGARVREAMLRKMILLPHGASIREAAEELLDTSQQEFPIVHGATVVGLLSRDALVEGLASSGPDSYVASIMDRDFLRLAPDASLEDNLTLLSDNEFTALVMEEDKLLGMVTRENLNEFLVLRNFGLRRATV
jgi:Zn-dependent protease/CBS domain-containing protein